MRRIFALSAFAAIGLGALAASSPAEASFHLIRWQDTGFCQIWDQSIPTAPYPGNFAVIDRLGSADLRRRADLQGRPAAHTAPARSEPTINPHGEDGA